MPKRIAEDDSDAASDVPKRAKKSSSYIKASSMAASVGASEVQKDENGDAYWPISKNGLRRVTLSRFKGMWMVNVREYYEQDGAKKPGKKGISLTLEQYAAFVEVMPQVEMLLMENGEEVPRPRYEGIRRSGGKDDDEDVDEQDVEIGVKGGTSRLNHEATSDEDE